MFSADGFSVGDKVTVAGRGIAVAGVVTGVTDTDIIVSGPRGETLSIPRNAFKPEAAKAPPGD